MTLDWLLCRPPASPAVGSLPLLSTLTTQELWASHGMNFQAFAGACGSIYVSALINALSDASSPLVESPNENSSITGSIQPQAPTATQTESFNEFARSIYDTPGIPFRCDRCHGPAEHY
jgi:hypothetical protein